MMIQRQSGPSIVSPIKLNIKIIRIEGEPYGTLSNAIEGKFLYHNPFIDTANIFGLWYKNLSNGVMLVVRVSCELVVSRGTWRI